MYKISCCQTSFLWLSIHNWLYTFLLLTSVVIKVDIILSKCLPKDKLIYLHVLTIMHASLAVAKYLTVWILYYMLCAYVCVLIFLGIALVCFGRTCLVTWHGSLSSLMATPTSWSGQLWDFFTWPADSLADTAQQYRYSDIHSVHVHVHVWVVLRWCRR